MRPRAFLNRFTWSMVEAKEAALIGPTLGAVHSLATISSLGAEYYAALGPIDLFLSVSGRPPRVRHRRLLHPSRRRDFGLGGGAGDDSSTSRRSSRCTGHAST